MECAISAESVSKLYRVGPSRGAYRTLRESIMDAALAPWRRLSDKVRRGRCGPDSAKSKDTLWAVRDLSFQTRPGEVVGIIGRNGAGKSTLLKILSRITEPTSGRVRFYGQLSSLLEVGTGFHLELTGRENVFLNGAILGMSRREIGRKFDQIVDFAEIDRLIDTPVKHYSSGMFVRLAFAVSAHLDPDILLIDEVLAVGDLAFQRKCMEHTRRLRERGGTALLVSHNMFAIKATCDRIIYLSKGRVGFDGPPEDGIHLYEQESRLDTLPWAQGRIGDDPLARPIQVTKVETLDTAGRPCSQFKHGEPMRVRVSYHAREVVRRPNIVVAFVRSDNVACCSFSTALDGFDTGTVSGDGAVELLVPPIKLISELYAIHVLIWDADFQRLYCAQIGTTFHVQHPVLSTHFGTFHEPAEWSWREEVVPAAAAGHRTPGF
jgi:lipopolysaccharide transport system ATP-binding protein